MRLRQARKAQQGKGSHLGEDMVFLRRFFGAPRQVGSVAPSSRFLTRAMLDRVDWAHARSVAELGAGTGVFTRSIVRRAHPEAKILVFEVDPALQDVIRAEHPDHPGLRLCGDAQELRAIMKEEGIESLDFVISSLPFTVLPHEVSENILDAVQDALRPGGRFVAYQYSSIMKPKLAARFPDIRTKFVPLNIPPAFVYDCGGDCREGAAL
ncbi:MAG: methyltransferase domain-containing protein [Fretibacterium sp.]|nr:methyltransferase domain-containing protein [Fretibacterium sp.]